MIEQDLQGLIDLDGLDAFGASEPPAILASAIAAIAQQPDVRKWLYEVGRWTAKRAILELKESIFGRPTPPNPWVAGIVDPWLDVITEGVLSVLKERARPWSYGLAVVTGLAGIGLGALVAGRKRRLVERVRRESKDE